MNHNANGNGYAPHIDSQVPQYKLAGCGLSFKRTVDKSRFVQERELAKRLFKSEGPTKNVESDGLNDYDNTIHNSNDNQVFDNPNLDVHRKAKNIEFENKLNNNNNNNRRGKTRSKLMAERFHSAIPDISYDIDQDGVVGERDYFVSQFFDEGKKLYLTKQERKKAIDAIEKEGFLDKFKFGFAASGCANPELLTSQKMGKIITANNLNDVADAYPRRYPVDHVPKHWCGSEMKADRLAEKRNYGNDYYNQYRKKNPLFKPLVPLERSKSEPLFKHLHERAEADHQEARLRAGLFPVPTMINPEKENMMPGLSYVRQPEIRTRSELKQVRKECMRRDNDQLRKCGEENALTPRINRSQIEEAASQMKKNKGDNMTLTLLNEQRRREKVEYDRDHFHVNERIYPRYSDQGDGFWTLGREGNKKKNPKIMCPQQVLKVTEEWFPEADIRNVEIEPAKKYDGRMNLKQNDGSMAGYINTFKIDDTKEEDLINNNNKNSTVTNLNGPIDPKNSKPRVGNHTYYTNKPYAISDPALDLNDNKLKAKISPIRRVEERKKSGELLYLQEIPTKKLYQGNDPNRLSVRLFDNIIEENPQRGLSTKDFESLDHSSSFDVIRHGQLLTKLEHDIAQRQQKQMQQENNNLSDSFNGTIVSDPSNMSLMNGQLSNLPVGQRRRSQIPDLSGNFGQKFLDEEQRRERLGISGLVGLNYSPGSQNMSDSELLRQLGLKGGSLLSSGLQYQDGLMQDGGVGMAPNQYGVEHKGTIYHRQVRFLEYFMKQKGTIYHR